MTDEQLIDNETASLMRETNAQIEKFDEQIRKHRMDIKEMKEILKDDLCYREAEVDKLRRLVAGEDLTTMHQLDDLKTGSDTLWQAVRLETLRIKPRYLKALEKAGIETVGQLAEYTSDKDLSFLNGMGKAAADHIADVMEAFHNERRLLKSPDAA